MIKPIFSLIRKLNYLFILVLFFSFSFAGNLKSTAQLMKQPLFELNENDLNIIAKKYLNENQDVDYIIITDLLIKQEILAFYKDDKNNILITPKNDIDYKCKLESENIIYNKELLGRITICKKEKNDLNLTKKEVLWLKNNPIIKVGGEEDWAPFDFVKNGTYQGISKDIIDLIAKKTNLQIKYITNSSWKILLNKFKNGKIDILPALYFTKERENFSFFTKPYFNIKDYVFTRKEDSSIKSLEDLNNKTIAVIDGYAVINNLKKEFPKVHLLKVKNLQEGIDSLLLKKADVYIEAYPTMMYILSENVQTGIKPVMPLNFYTNSLHIGITKSQPILASIIDKALNSLTAEEKNTIIKKWIVEIEDSVKPPVLNLTKKEQLWLKKRDIVKFSVDPNWMPIEGINKDTYQYEGIISDILKRISELSGIKFELVTTKKWEQSVNLIKSNKIDMLAAASVTKERKNFLNFSDTTIKLNDGVITRNDGAFISSLADLKGLRVGIAKDTALHKKVAKEFPLLNLIPILGTQNGLKQLIDKKIDAYLGNLEVASLIVFRNSYYNLKVSLKIDTQRELKIALRKDYPIEALSIINKALSQITENEKQTIKDKWIGLKVEEGLDYTLFYKIAVGFVLLILVVFYWNRKLQSLVDAKTSELKILLKAFDKNVIASKTDEKGIITYVSDAFCEISGYSKKELLGKPHNIVRHVDMPKDAFKDMWSKLKAGETWKGEVKNLKKDDGYYWVDAVVSPEYNSKNEFVGYSSIRHDITAKKEVEELTKTLEQKVKDRTIDLEKTKLEIEEIHKNTKDSIEYAALIQHTLIPSNDLLKKHFSDYLTIWHPKDIVGGDIYLFEELEDDKGCILMVIDCTGHGVPGAFVTMLVKAIERQIISRIINTKEEVSPAKILSIFNKSMKHLLKQEDDDSISNAGFDGGILYFNKQKNILKFAGAEVPLFYEKNGKVSMIKGDRHSIGYKKSNSNHEFKEYQIEIEKGMHLYLTTDGYLDQNGGSKGFPYGKRRFTKLIEKNCTLALCDQQEIILYEMMEYQGNFERNDDITIIGLKI